MRHERFFPVVIGQRREAEVECAVGWELSGLLQAQLWSASSWAGAHLLATGQADHPDLELFHNREALLQAVASWPNHLMLELNLVSLPDLEFPYRGTLLHGIVLRARATTEAAARELVLHHFVRVNGLLNSCFPEAQWSPVHEESRLLLLTTPFAPVSAVRLTRPNRSFDLAQPIAHTSSGFTARIEPVASPAARLPYPASWVVRNDTQQRLVHYLLWQAGPAWICVRVRAAAEVSAERNRLEQIVRQCDAHLQGLVAHQSVNELQAKLLRSKALQRSVELDHSGLEGAILVFGVQAEDHTLVSLVGSALSGVPANRNATEDLVQGIGMESVDPSIGSDPWRFPAQEYYTPAEMAGAFRIPSPPQDDLPGMPVARFRTAFVRLPQPEPPDAERVLLGVNRHRTVCQPVYCRLQNRMQHMFILGMTGTGKSTLMENMILQDIRAGHGLCVVDPHNDMIPRLLGKIPPERERDVIFVNFQDREFPVGFNLLEWQSLEDRDRIIDDLYVSMHQTYNLYEVGGPIFERNFRNMLKLLMGDRKRKGFTPTLLEFPALYQHEPFRKYLLSTMDDPLVADFLEELEEVRGEGSLANIAPYVSSKFARFTSDTLLARIIGQSRSGFDFRSVMDEGKIVLINLAKGAVGSTVGGLLASQIVNRFKNAAMSRADLPEHRRRPFFLYVDEFQNLPHSEFVELLAEARKYRLGLILANQFASQLRPANHHLQGVLEAILGNVGTFVSFRLGSEDAGFLGKVFEPTFGAWDLKSLPDWQAYVQLRIEGQVLNPFNVETVRDETPVNMSAARRLMRQSRRQYGKKAQEVDAEIAARRRLFKDEDARDRSLLE